MARPQRKYSEQDKKIIQKAYSKCKDVKEQKRFLCLKLRIEKGFSSKQIAEVVGYSPTFINEIISRYNKHGVIGLQAKEQVGNRRNLTLEQEKDILNSFSQQAESGKMLEVSDIIRGYEDTIGRRVAKSIVYKMLKRHGWRKLMPRSKHPKKASTEEINAYKKNHTNSTKNGKYYF